MSQVIHRENICLTSPGFEPATLRTWGVRFTTMPPSRQLNILLHNRAIAFGIIISVNVYNTLVLVGYDCKGGNVYFQRAQTQYVCIKTPRQDVKHFHISKKYEKKAPRENPCYTCSVYDTVTRLVYDVINSVIKANFFTLFSS